VSLVSSSRPSASRIRPLHSRVSVLTCASVCAFVGDARTRNVVEGRHRYDHTVWKTVPAAPLVPAAPVPVPAPPAPPVAVIEPEPVIALPVLTIAWPPPGLVPKPLAAPAPPFARMVPLFTMAFAFIRRTFPPETAPPLELTRHLRLPRRSRRRP
jgi:hypothetical protein